MGIDGRVYCNCLKEGKTTPPPFEQSYICQDQESGFWYIKEDLPEELQKKYSIELEKWIKDCCCHKEMKYAYEQIGNSYGLSIFLFLINKAGKEKFQVLNQILTHREGKIEYDLVQKAIKELKILKEAVCEVNGYFAVDISTDQKLYYNIEGQSIWIGLSGSRKTELDFCNGKIVIKNLENGEILFSSAHFTQIAEGSKEDKKQNYILTDIDSGYSIRTVHCISSGVKPPKEIVIKKRKLIPEDIYAVKNLAVLLQASLDTQNPIYYG